MHGLGLRRLKSLHLAPFKLALRRQYFPTAPFKARPNHVTESVTLFGSRRCARRRGDASKGCIATSTKSFVRRAGVAWTWDEAENGAESKHEPVRRAGVGGKGMIMFDKKCKIFPCRTIGALLYI